MKVPTFQCYRNGQRLESATLVVPQKIIDMLERHRQQGGGQKNRLAVFLATLASIGLATFGIVYFVKRNSDDFDDAGGEDGSAWCGLCSPPPSPSSSCAHPFLAS